MFFASRSSRDIRNFEETSEGFQMSGLGYLQALAYQEVTQNIYDGDREIVCEIEEVLGSERIGKSFDDVSYRLVVKFRDISSKPTLEQFRKKFRKKLGVSSENPSPNASSPIP